MIDRNNLSEHDRALQLASTMVEVMRERHGFSETEMNFVAKVAMQVLIKAWDSRREPPVVRGVGERGAEDRSRSGRPHDRRDHRLRRRARPEDDKLREKTR